ncbi:MAG TPA: TRAP transporter substrate-binding protein DctP, partial [Polyangia bacterium]
MRARLAMSALSVLLTMAALVTAAPAQQPIVLKLSHFLGPTSFFQVDFAQPWAHELEARTNGKVKVEIFDSTSPYGEVTKQAAQVEAGTIDIALGLRGAEQDRFPRSAVAELPFVVHDSLSGSRALWGVARKGLFGGEWDGYKLLALSVHNPGLIHTASKRIVAPADMKGVRFRAPNKAVAAALDSLGAVPVILQVNDVMTAVQAHRIDGIV